MSDTYMISFSGGRTSAYMTDKLLKEDKYKDALICFANTGKEKLQTLDFVHQCDQLWGGRVVWLEYDPVQKYRIVMYETASREGEPFAALIKKKGFVPNIVARFCTQELKVRVIKHYMMDLGYEHWTNIIGIRYDEPLRWAKTKGIASRERWDNETPLVNMRVTKPMVLDYWQQMPFDLHLKDYEGNCDMCFLKGKHKKKQIIRDDRTIADWWIRMEKETGGTFHKLYSYEQLVRMIEDQPELFNEDMDIECFCNAD